MPPRAETMADFSGGIDAKTSPHLVPPNKLMRGMNILFDQDGAIRTRNGYSIANANSPVLLFRHLGFGTLVTAGGVATLVASQDQATGRNFLYLTNTNPWTFIGESSQGWGLVDIIQFVNIVIMTDGYAPPKYYNPALPAGSQFGPIIAQAGQTQPPGGLYAINHLNQLWLWNTAATRGALSGPSSLQACDVGNVNSWPNTFQVFLGDDSDKGTGLATFSIGETGIAPFPILVAFKGYTAYQINGTFGQSNFSIQQIRTDQGCMAPKSIQFVPGLGIIRLTQAGFYLYDGLNDVNISSPSMDPYLFGDFGLQRIDTGGELAALSQSVLYPYPQTYMCACPVNGVVRRWFCFDIKRKSWTVFDILSTGGQGLTALKKLQGFASNVQIGSPTVPMAFDFDRNIYGFAYAATTDNGMPIQATIRVPPLPRRSPLRQAFYSRVLAKVYGCTAGQQVTLQTAIGPAQNPAYAGGTQTINQQTLVAAQPGTAGTFDPVEPLASNMEVALNFDIGRTGELMHTDVSWTGPLTLRGLEFQGVPKPVTRPVRT